MGLTEAEDIKKRWLGGGIRMGNTCKPMAVSFQCMTKFTTNKKIIKKKKRWQEYTEELYKKDLYDPDNHSGVITHLEPDILECKVKSALGSITTNKVSGGDGIPVELFQILKDDAVKVLHSICQQIWKTQQCP